MELDFMSNLRDEVNTLGLSLICKLGELEPNESLVVYMLPGGRTTGGGYDGTIEKRFNLEFAVKTKSLLEGYQLLNKVGRHLELLSNLPSKNDSYEFMGIVVASEPNEVGDGVTDYKIHTMSVQADIELYEGVLMNG